MPTFLHLSSPLIYNITLAKTHLQSTPTRCVSPLHFRVATVAKDAVVRRPSANYKPPVWDHDFLLSLENQYAKEGKVEERAKGMKKEMRKMLAETEEGYIKRLELVDNVQRLGISYHFEHEIDNILTKIYNERNRSGGVKQSRTKEDLHATALEFRLLRQHGFNVSQGY